MSEKQVLGLQERPEGYVPPTFNQVNDILNALKVRRQPVMDRIWEVKKIRRGQWAEVVQHIPAAYRKMVITPDLPVVRDMIQRITGLVSKNMPMPQVTPGSIRGPEIEKAATEEAKLAAIHLQIEDQQDRPAYAMGIDAQVAWGESWLSVWPDASVYSPKRPKTKEEDDGDEGDSEWKMRDDEEPEDYLDRYGKQMAGGLIPICIDDHDPQTLYPFHTDRNRLGIVVIETEHESIDVELGMGYRAIKDRDGKTEGWEKVGTLTEGTVPGENRGSSGLVDITHATNLANSNSGPPQQGRPIRKICFNDPWTYQVWLDGHLVEQWEHNFGVVPLFPAYGEQTSDRDPAWQSVGVADAAISVAKQVIMFAAVLASNSMQHGFPTPFLKNPSHGLIHPVTGEPLTRRVQLGEMNLLAQGEEIEFPYLKAQMMPDFFRHMEWLTQQLEGSTLSNFGKAIGSDMAGYAVAQIRSMQMSILSTLYKNATRQWRKIFYFLRHLIRSKFPAGIYLRGAVEEDEETGQQFRPILKYGPEDCTDYPIEVVIDEGIIQDEIAERKSALEMMQAGVWSPRRVMEKTGVEDAAKEQDEIAVFRMANSQEADQNVLQMAMQIAAQRYVALDNQQKSSLFSQAVERVKQGFMAGGGQFQNQGSQPANATPGGQPMQQQPNNGQQPGATGAASPAGPAPGVGGTMGLPGGVPGGQVPVGAPG